MFGQPWTGVYAAILCPFGADEAIDEAGMAAYAGEIAGVDGVMGLVANGHTGEVVSLLPEERARVTAVAAGAVGGSVKVASGVCAEGSAEAIVHARAAKDAGADAGDRIPDKLRLRRTLAGVTRWGVGMEAPPACAGAYQGAGRHA